MTEPVENIRTFIAVTIDEDVRNSLERAIGKLKRTGAHVKWVPANNIHLTLSFIGDTSPDDIPHIKQVLNTIAAQNNPFEFMVYGLGFFGTDRFPRIVWAGLKGSLSPLFSLQEQTVAGLESLQIGTDSKKYKPHLTLGRVRSSRNAVELLEAIAKQKQNVFGSIKVESIVLMKSELHPDGARYSPLHIVRFSEKTPNVES